MVANQAGVTREAAEEALISTKGDLAEAILKLAQYDNYCTYFRFTCK